MISLPKLIQKLKPSVEETSQLPAALAAIVAEWEAETNTLWASRTGHVHTFSTLGAQTLLRLPFHTVTAITEVKVGTTLSDLAVKDPAEYTLSGHWLVRYSGIWEPLVRVVMNGGYADDAAPADVLFALQTQIEYARQMTAGEKLTHTSVALNGATTAFRQGARHPIYDATVLRRRRLC